MKKCLSRLREGGTDSTLSWLTAAGCFTLYFFSIGTNRSTGVIFNALVELYPNSSKQELSWPFTLTGTAVIYAAPLTGFLCTRFSMLAVTLVGVAIFTLGTFPCYFNTNVIFMSVFFGFIRGTGMSLATTAIPGIVSINFERYKATAMGFTISGLSLGALVFPIFTQFILDKHGLENTFLIYGVLALCSAVGALPLIVNRTKGTTKTTSKTQAPDDKLQGTANPAFEEEFSSTDKVKDASSNGKGNEVSNNGKIVKDRDKTPIETVSSKVPMERYSEIEWTPDIDREYSERRQTEKVGISNTNKEFQTANVGAIETVKTVLKSRGFYLITANNVSGTMVAGVYGLVIVNYAVDKGLQNSQGVYLLTISASAELAGTLFLSCLADRNYVSRVTFITVTSLMTVAGLLVIIFSTNYGVIIASSVLMSLGLGGTFSVSNALYCEYIGKQHIVMAVTLTRSVAGLSFLPRSPLIGYFRDTLGSYDYVCYLLAAFLGLSISGFIVENFYRRYLSRNQASELP